LGVRLLATARSERKVQELSKTFPAVHFKVLDITDVGETESIVKKVQLVVNCIGPFDLYGENVVSACAKTGTHYLDITGEILFARRMIEKYDALAKKSGAMIVPFAGFDSVPSDIGVFLMGQEMSIDHAQAVASIDSVFKAKGGLNGGTIATGLNTAVNISKKDQENLNFLVSDQPDRIYRELNRLRYIAHLKKWVAPFFMEPINNKVVYRSVALANKVSNCFAKDFRYRESMQVPGGILGAVLATGLLFFFQILLKMSLGRKLASRLLPKPGEGPSENQMKEGYFEATFIAIGTEGKVLMRKMTSDGDPGNVSTVKLLLACIRTMMNEGFQSRGGLLTPSSAFGTDLLPALHKSGVNWIE